MILQNAKQWQSLSLLLMGSNFFHNQKTLTSSFSFFCLENPVNILSYAVDLKTSKVVLERTLSGYMNLSKTLVQYFCTAFWPLCQVF